MLLNEFKKKETSPGILFGICVLAIIISSFFACSGYSTNTNQGTKKTTTDSTHEVKAIPKPPSAYTDTLIVNSPAAVFFNPDSIQVEKFKSIVSNNMFESMKHDCYYQQRNSKIVMRKYWPEIRIVEMINTRYILFVKADKSTVCLDLDHKGDMCGIILFNTKKEPQLIDMMNIETELDYYFKH